MATDDDVADFINNGSGARLPAFKFVNFGDSVLGTVVRKAIRDVPVIGKPGETERQLLIELKTDETYTQPGKDRQTGAPITITGDEWAVWVKSPSQMLTALAEALKAGDAANGAPHPGDRLAVTFTGTEASKTQGFAPKKVYKVLYKKNAQAQVPAAVAAGGGAVSVEDL